MGGRDSVVGTGDPLMRGPERHRLRGQCVGTGDPRKGARGASLPRERWGGVAREGTPQFRELVGTEAVWCPGVPLSENRQREVPAKGSHASQP